MFEYHAPVKDYLFLLNEFLQGRNDNDLNGIKGFGLKSQSQDYGQLAKFCESSLLSVGSRLDKDGVKYVGKTVTVHKEFKKVYNEFYKKGFNSFSVKKTDGGKGRGSFFNVPVVESLSAACLPLAIINNISFYGYSLISRWASKELKSLLLPEIIKGNISFAISLDSSILNGDENSNSTLRLLKDKKSGHSVSGMQSRVVFGDHDLSGNIIHIVLIGDGLVNKGKSLLLVPKFKITKTGKASKDSNKISCKSLYDNIGIKSVPICDMSFSKSDAILIGKEGQGEEIVDSLANEFRLANSLLPLGVSDLSSNLSSVYIARHHSTNSAAKSLTIKSYVEGCRALALLLCYRSYISKESKDNHTKQNADDFVMMSSPVIKAFISYVSNYVVDNTLHIYGIDGYFKENKLDQLISSVRFFNFYGGNFDSNSKDLVLNQLPKFTGRYLRSFFHPVTEFVAKNRDDQNLSDFTKHLYKAISSCQNAALWIAANSMADKKNGEVAANDFLKLLALTMLGYVWSDIARISFEAIKKEGADKEFYQDKIRTAKFFVHKILPEHYSLLAKIANGSDSLK